MAGREERRSTTATPSRVPLYEGESMPDRTAMMTWAKQMNQIDLMGSGGLMNVRRYARSVTTLQGCSTTSEHDKTSRSSHKGLEADARHLLR